jgi:DNA-binding MarR family transcriptional regulator
MKKTKNSSNSAVIPSKEDITKCYGIACEECPETCPFKVAGISVISEERHSKNVSSGATRVYNFIEEFEERFTNECASSPESSGANILRLFYWSLKKAPRGTMAILERAFEGVNQSEAARRRGVTRQAVSKLYKRDLATLADLLGIKQPNLPESRLWTLSPLEFQVMQILHADHDISERQIAEKLSVNRSAVHRAKVAAINKMNHISSSKRPSKRTTQKAS